MVVLDTCAIIELCKEKIEISTKTLKAIEQGAFILSICFAEIACKMKTGKLTTGLPLDTLVQNMKQMKAVTIVDIGIDEWIESIDLSWPDNKDPADRMITAFAMKHDLSIITTDNKIKHFYKKVSW